MTQEAQLDPSDQPKFTDHIQEILLDTELPFDVDWAARAETLTLDQRLIRLAKLKAILPPDNAIGEKTTHDVTIENYIHLALDAAGDVATIDEFLPHIIDALKQNPDQAQNLAQQVFWIWGPVSEIAGLYEYKEVLEDLAFAVLEPEEYAKLALDYEKDLLEAEGGLLEKTSQTIQERLEAAFGGAVSFKLQTRAKSHFSVWRKLRSEKRANTELFDLLGFRVVIQDDSEEAVGHCYSAMAAVAGAFDSELTRLKDYIDTPKSNGYQSLHLTLYTSTGFPFELQVRTEAMHERAETSSDVSHQGYDATFKAVPGKITRVYQKVPKLYKWRDTAAAYIQENNGTIEGFMDGELLFFRTDGNLYRIPNDANILDASFRIHSRKALRTKAVYDRGKLVSFDSPVKHGAVLEVGYKDRSQYPTERAQFDSLIGTVRTLSSKKSIEQGWRKVDKPSLIKKGRAIIGSMIRELGLDDPVEMLDEVEMRELADRVGVPSFDDLLVLVAAGNRAAKPTRIVNKIKDAAGLGPIPKIKLGRETLKTLSNDQVLGLVDVPSSPEGKTDWKVAGCCTGKIKRGDPVLVRPSKAEGILKLHLQDCVNIRDNSDTINCVWV